MRANIKKAVEPTIKIHAYGGTAATYALAEPQGEPFKEGDTTYINVKLNGVVKRVRWYTDEAHDDGYSKWHIKIPHRPLWSHFFFESEDDTILVVKCKLDFFDNRNNEIFDDFHRAGFSHRTFFGGCWIAPKSAMVPAGYEKKYKAEVCDWPTLKIAGRANCEKQTRFTKEWFQ